MANQLHRTTLVAWAATIKARRRSHPPDSIDAKT